MSFYDCFNTGVIKSFFFSCRLCNQATHSKPVLMLRSVASTDVTDPWYWADRHTDTQMEAIINVVVVPLCVLPASFTVAGPTAQYRLHYIIDHSQGLSRLKTEPILFWSRNIFIRVLVD